VRLLRATVRVSRGHRRSQAAKPRHCEPPACRGAAALRARGKAASCRGKAARVRVSRRSLATRPACDPPCGRAQL